MKTCSKCHETKSLDWFGKLKSSPDGLKYDCKECRHNYNIANREKISEKNKSYYETHKSELLIKNKEYRLNNIDAIHQQKKQYRSDEKVKAHIQLKNKEYLPIRKNKIKELRKTNLNFKLSEVLRSKFHKYLKNHPTSMVNVLGCDLEFFKEWISFRFDKNMNWSNYGSQWHIDHVLPINMFNFMDENDIKVCYHWTNLQPLQKFENQSKSDNLELHHYFNNLVNVFRFKCNNNHNGYQAVNESLQWLRSKLRYGKNPTYDNNNMLLEIDNPQPRL